MREIDRLTTGRYAVPPLLLMENAALASVRAIARRFPDGFEGRRALVLCGRGNNGGDGAAVARLLAIAGARADILLFGRVDETKGDARANFEIARRLAKACEGSAQNSSSGDAHGSRKPDGGNHALFANSLGALSFAECETVEAWEDVSSRIEARDYDLCVDALFGTGLTRPLTGTPEKVVNFLSERREARDSTRNRHPIIVSLDLPSGLDADANEPVGPAVRADLTITFTAPKPANVMPPASIYNGELAVADIGSPRRLINEAASKIFILEDEDAAVWLRRTRYAPGSYKNTHGHALVVAGSRDMTGAAVLSANAAMRAGAGLVTVATAASALSSVAARLMPEVMAAPLAETEQGGIHLDALVRYGELAARASVVAVGCGLAREESTRRFVRELVERREGPVVVDADGLNALAPWPKELRGRAGAPLILTPHEGEMLRLLGSRDRAALRERASALSGFASEHGLIVVLKGTRTLVAAPDGRVFINPTGNAGLGTAGSGDTLTGIITGFLAQSYASSNGAERTEEDAVEAVTAAVYVAGLAGEAASREHGLRAMTASDVRAYLSDAIRALDPEGEVA